MELKEMDIQELKALAFDKITELQTIQQDIQALNQEIFTRGNK